MDRYRIRTSETDSVKGIASKQFLDVSLQQTTKALPFPNVSATLSQRSVYEQERQTGNKFRLILTIMPYCTNVLFNPLTEIIKNEGSTSVEVVTDSNKAKSASGAIGGMTPDRIHMIENTEYSSEQHGSYEYHPGYDFFDNHLLRNTSFKMVNPNPNDTNVFNTLSDYVRDRNGETQILRKRVSIYDTDNLNNMNNKKHLYLADDILKIDESINQNLYEENGWWGFTNNTTIDPKSSKNRTWYSLDIGKALNNYKACEFIDMYPDRTLFSFTPKFNKFTHENENNWNVVLTYPYKNIYTHPLCYGGSSYMKRSLNDNGDYVDETVSEGNKWMGLKVMTVQLGQSNATGNNLIFRTYTKHGLSKGDTFYLYYTNPYMETESYGSCEKFSDTALYGNETYYESEKYHKVTNVGDLSRNNEKYFFYTSDTSLLQDIYKSYIRFMRKRVENNTPVNEMPFYDLYKDDDKKDIYDSDGALKSELLNKILTYTNFRIRRCVNGVKSTYYVRQFRKIPNLCAKRREMTDEEKLHKSKFNGVFDKYIMDNALDPTNPNYQRTFKKETYQLAFSANIFNDNATQITFTDGIDTEGLTDNLGRPLSQIYYTIVKNNAGYEAWYDSESPKYKVDEALQKKYGYDYKIEFSHCFGKVTSGFDIFMSSDDTESNTAPIDYLKKLSSIRHITNVINSCSGVLPVREDDISSPLEDDIKYKDTFFYGDMVEFNAADFKEYEICKVMHRFNTAQRETINNPNYSQYQYHEITSDDFDKDGFTVTEYSAVGGIVDDERSQKDYAAITRPEGYYYQAHYPLQIREYTKVKQSSHFTLRVKSAKPVQKNGILIQVKTSVSHGLSPNDVIFIYNKESDIRYITKCVQVINRSTFLMSPDYDEYVVNATDFEDSKIVSNIKDSVMSGTTESYSSKNNVQYKNRFSWLELCNILNGTYKDDLSYPTLTLLRKNTDIPDYATYIGGNRYLWREIVNIGDMASTELDDYIFANGYFYVTNRINFFLRRQDPFGNNGLYYDGEDKYPCFPNDPSGDKQSENYYITKETETSC